MLNVNKEIVRQIKQEVKESLETGAYNKLIDYLNGKLDSDNISKQDNKIDNSATKKVNIESELNNSNEVQENIKTNFNEKEFYEGQIIERTILQRERNQEIVKLAKQRDNYTCQACGFSYYEKIVQAHHLVPLSNQNEEYEIKIEDLITLCPTCHSLAHILLNDNEIYTNNISLITELKKIRKIK